MSIYVCRHRAPMRRGIDLHVSPERVIINGVNGSHPDLGVDETIPFPETVISLAGLRERKDFADFSLYVVGFDLINNVIEAPFNAHAATQVSKLSPRELAQSLNIMLSMHIFVPTATCDFTECSIVSYVHSDFGFTCNLPHREKEWTGLPLVDRTLLRLTAPAEIAAGQSARCDIEMLDHQGDALPKDCTVFLESTGAYLPRQRIAIQGGRGAFDTMALGMQAGDVFKVKAGFKYFSGIAEHTFVVV